MTASSTAVMVSEVRGDVAAAFLREGAFMTPSRGVTVFVRRIGAEGTLDGVFIHDARQPGQIATYTAERAVLLSDQGATRLVMFDGVAQILDEAQPEALSILRFTQFGYDLSEFGEGQGDRLRKPSELFVTELLAIDAAEAETRRRPLGEFRAEAHEALSAPLYAIALPFVAVAVIVVAGFRRHGTMGRILVAVGAGVVLRMLGLAAKGATAGTAALWPLMYVPPVLGILLACALLSARGMAPGGWFGGGGGRGGRGVPAPGRREPGLSGGGHAA
ncbi:MAG: LptF/LptG family permease [Pseudomonadota bacterium]